MYDCIIVGAGPAGTIAAITASKSGNKVLLIEKNSHIGKKLLISGGGRCNITNMKSTKDFISNLPNKNGKFLYSALTNFSSSDIVEYFNALGVETKIEDNDRVFPKSNKAYDVVHALEKELSKSHVKVNCEENVEKITVTNDLWNVITNKGKYISKKIIITTGGVTYPQTGSTGDGHVFAKNFGHTITALFPAETPLLSNDECITSKELQGLSMSPSKLSLTSNSGKILNTQVGDLIFTHFGLSGPCALRLSQFIYLNMLDNNSNSANVLVDFIPNVNNESLSIKLKHLRDSNSKKLVYTFLTENNIPKRLTNYIISKISLIDVKICDLSNKKINELVDLIKTFEITVHGVKPLQKAFVTGGGIDIKEVNSKTMESKILSGLYFAGEVLDLHGFTGGYNITIAFATGHLAGNSI